MNMLDCTLRDGGYYNNWDFPQNIVKAYLNAVADAGIDYVELGLRSFPKSGFLGAYAYTTEQHLNTLDLPKGPTYGVMVDAKTILSAGMDPVAAVDALFVPREESKVDLVRIAAHFHEVEHSTSMVARLKELGYIVGYNLMQSGGKPSELIAEKARIAASWGDNLDVLYFADSLGNMDKAEVERIIKAIRTEWTGPIGIHTHDNMSKGLDNSLTAKNNGVEWLDATITGMGRGAGNTQTERLLAVIAKEHGYNAQPVYDLVVRHFEKMQKDYGWGTNLLYFLGAQNDVHPTYIQNLLSNSHYGTDEIIGAIDYLSQLDGTTAYNGEVLATALSFNGTEKSVSGSRDIQNLFAGREVLLLTNAPTVERYQQAIEQYIEEKKPVVLSLNINQFIAEDKIDYYVMTHNAKFLSEASEYQRLSKPLILPLHRFNMQDLERLTGLTTLDFGFSAQSEDFAVSADHMNSKFDLTAAYALGIAKAGQAQITTLVGFDGFDKNDPRQMEMIELVQAFQQLGLSLKAITPTSYPVEQGSVYAIH
jgi:4-hydroxy 2-oxovalerate aldolase